ncbi:hypothetical protein MKW92_023980 [Papaver armeniacum]|nr:hypothetical protein MKW92_023980 [Papaver armeniacum]
MRGSFICLASRAWVSSESLGFNYQRSRNFTNRAEEWNSIVVISYVYGYNHLRSRCAYNVAPGGLLDSVYRLTRIEYGVDQVGGGMHKIICPKDKSRELVDLFFGFSKRADFQEWESYAFIFWNVS